MPTRRCVADPVRHRHLRPRCQDGDEGAAGIWRSRARVDVAGMGERGDVRRNVSGNEGEDPIKTRSKRAPGRQTSWSFLQPQTQLSSSQDESEYTLAVPERTNACILRSHLLRQFSDGSVVRASWFVPFLRRTPSSDAAARADVRTAQGLYNSGAPHRLHDHKWTPSDGRQRGW